MLIPEGLAAYNQFILWIAVPSDTRPGKYDKFPIHPVTGRKHDAHDPSIWLSGQQALAALQAGTGNGIGFVFTERDPFFFFDIDNAVVDGQWSPLAQQLCGYMQGCYVEVSFSGTGLHFIGSVTDIPHRTRDIHRANLELYTKLRFCALTGISASGTAAHPAQEQFNWLVTNYFPPAEAGQHLDGWTDGPCPEWSGPEDDEQLIAKMLGSKQSAGSMFGAKASLRDLWYGDANALAAAYPPRSEASQINYGFDHSDADAALCAHLAFWTGRDCERIDRLFRLSGLMRDKWESREGYRHSTVTGAASRCKSVYSGGKPASDPAHSLPPAADSPTMTAPGATGLRDGLQLMSVPTQLDYFKGCVYIREVHKTFVPDGALLNPERFRASYGGYIFAMDLINDKTSKSAWEAFTENNGYNFPKAHNMCFRPELQPGGLTEEEGQILVNTYVPVVTRQLQGDPSRFLDYLARLLPVPDDRAILLAYMAALVQYPGVKFQWCPLIQGVEGNGKTLLTRVLAYAVGNRHTHLPKAEEIDSRFNAWLLGKLFIGVEEVYTADRQAKLDALKPLITNDRVEIQGKGDNQVTADNRANFLMCSNHKDAIRKTESDRRYCIFYTAQQEFNHILQAGMGGDYFPDLYDWLKGDGYAIVNWYLRTYPIPDALNPATRCHRAPTTSTTAEAIQASRGGIEQEVIEAIEGGRPGFAGGWVSSTAFEALLDAKRYGAKIPQNRRRDILRSLGYDWHPALKDGRVNNTIMDCGIAGKPRLFIKTDHPHIYLQTAAEVVRFYQAAQSGGTTAGAVFGGAV